VRPLIASAGDVRQGVADLDPAETPGWREFKTLWFSVPAYQGPFVIRAERLDKQGPIRLGGSGLLPTSASPLVVPAGPTLNSWNGWRTVPSGTWAKSPGCYAWQVDGRTFSETIVVRAAWLHSETLSFSSASRARSTQGARQTLVEFFRDVQEGRYRQGCAMYTAAVRALVDRDFGGCVRNLAGVHALAQNERHHGLPDLLSKTIHSVQVASFSISGNTATTADLGRRGTVTTLLYRNGRWQVNRPAT
jgi:hypothetical protein